MSNSKTLELKRKKINARAFKFIEKRDEIIVYLNVLCVFVLTVIRLILSSVASGQLVRKCSGSQFEAKSICKFGDLLADVCEFCDSDGCNGAAQYAPMAVMIISIPIAIVKLFSQ